MIVRVIVVLAILLIPTQAHAAGYVVRPGDTLTTIAQRQHVTVGSIVRANGLRDPNLIQAGRVLVIPGAATAPVTTYGSRFYQVQWGDTLIGIGSRYGMSVATVRSLNPQMGIYPLAGQWIRVCYACQPVETASAPAASQAAIYVVHAGDTLGAIAARYGVSTTALVAVNSLVNPNVVRIGSRLALPSGAAAAVAAPLAAPATTAVYDPYTARSLIATYADYYGVSRAMAFAVAWQESGFNQTLISSTGAVGVMQVEPYTGAHIAQLLGRPFNLYNIRDNVQAGTYWLSRLLAYYGGNARLAIGAYYQGTASIARRGFFSDTAQYVDNVTALMIRFGG